MEKIRPDLSVLTCYWLLASRFFVSVVSIMGKTIKNFLLISVVAAVGASSLLTACGKNDQPTSTTGKDTSAASSGKPTQMKPTPVSAARVAIAAIREITRVSRPLQSFLGEKTASDLNDPFAQCQKAGSFNRGIGSVDWLCAFKLLGVGEIKVEGTEILDFDSKANRLKSNGQFTLVFPEDLESVKAPYTVESSRVIKIVFAKKSTPDLFDGRLTIHSESMKVNRAGVSRDKIPSGNKWGMTMAGSLSRENMVTKLGAGMNVQFSGLLHGDFSERKMAWASGDYQMTSESEIILEGFGQSPCVKPIGKWLLIAKGDGETLNAEVVTSEKGVSVDSGSIVPWPALMCYGP